ncbi:MAG TPA: PilN domain-containing protein [Roseiarcus sp.]|nr:PilN domain-containing protein [Roseiarcus sp.]
MPLAILARWLEELASILTDARQWLRARRSVFVKKNGESLVIRGSASADAPTIANVRIGDRPPRDLARALRVRFVNFELGPADFVTRRLAVPAQARDVLSGVVRNQMERLSPWPVANSIYGFEASNSKDDAKSLDVRILISLRKTIDSICEQSAAAGLPVDRILARVGSDASSALLTLWTRPSLTGSSTNVGAPKLIFASLAALLVASALVTSWASVSASGIWAEKEDVAARIEAFRRTGSSAGAKGSSLGRSPTERAWAMKEQAPAAVFVLEALTKALPDGAYLTEFNLERATLRVTGLAADPPPLIAALEQSNQFTGAHFFAVTTKDAESALYKFSIEAQVAPRAAPIGE